MHAHEMIYGTAVAVIAGFLLTAVPNWTGRPRLGAGALSGLVLLYLAGRVAVYLLGVLGPLWIAILDVAFLPVLTVLILRPIVSSRNWRNLPVVAVLFVLALANAAIHMALVQRDQATLRAGIYASVYAVVMMMIIISGRIVPAFTRNAERARGSDAIVLERKYVGPLSMLIACAALLADLWQPRGGFASGLAFLAAPLLLVRQSGWQFRRVLDRPMLWILHVGHFWIVVGFLCLGLSNVSGFGIGAAALHALTAGAMGTLILGMMPRVALGHSGRPIEASAATVWMFGLVIAGALVRVIGAAGAAALYRPGLLLGGGLWTTAWIVFLFSYGPILIAADTRVK
jgi:uncharacterized protein involved in response to NO